MKFALRLVLLAAAAMSLAAQSLYNRNLIVNGDAEAGPAAPDGRTKASPIPGWTTYGSFTVLKYGPGGMGPDDYGPPSRGNNYFMGGVQGATRSYAEQTIRLDGVEAGTKFYLQAFLGKSVGAFDPKVTSVTISFQNDKGEEVQKAVLQGPANADYYNDLPPLSLRSMTGYLNTGIKQAKVTLDLATVDANQMNGLAADSLSLVLTDEPLMETNLILNGDAEVPERPLPGWPNVPPGYGKPVAGWNQHVSLWASTYGGWLKLTDPGPPAEARGKYFLLIENPRATFTGFQTIDLSVPSSKLDPAAYPKSKLSQMVDSGKVTYELRGWLGHVQDSRHLINFRVSFYDGVKTEPIAPPGETGVVRLSDHGDRNGLAERVVNGSVPAGTRQIRIELLGSQAPGVGLPMILAAENLSLILRPPESMKIASISNTASGVVGTAVAPGEMVTLTISGTEITGAAGMQLVDRNGPVGTALNGAGVTFDGVAAPLLWVRGGKVGTIVPFEVYGKEKVPVVLTYKGEKSAALVVDVVPAVPGIFTQEEPGTGSTAALVWNSDLRLNSSANPAAKGSVVIIFWTGGGQTDPGGTTGKIEMGSLPRPLLPVTVTIDGQPATVQYAGAVFGAWAGLLMAQVQVPEAASSGAVPVVITVTDPAKGELSSPAGAATISVQ